VVVPELPEVERAARRARGVAVGATIGALDLLHPALARRVPPRIRRSIVGRTVESLKRAGKHQLLLLDDGRSIHVHFRMSGDWSIIRDDDPLPRHARAVISFTDGRRLVLVDSRALSSVTVHARNSSPLPELGPEPLSDGIDAEYLRAALRSRKQDIKPALLDQRVIAGVGNIYAAEALWRARISPFAASSSISRRRLTRLADELRRTLEEAIDASEDEEDTFRVYGREGEPCPACGARIARRSQAGRSTYYCPRCQRR
jgi:formamidopyrimidine-DNA glycosylase